MKVFMSTSVPNHIRVNGCKLIVALMALIILVGVSGCSGNPEQGSGEQPAHKQKPRTVVVNKGMSKKEEKKLNERLDELEKKVGSQDKKSSDNSTENNQPEQSQQQVEDQVRAAAESYYQAAATR